MDKFTYDGKNQKMIEQFLLMIYTIYCSILVYVIFRQNESSLLGYFMLTGIFVCWLLYVTNCKSYTFRAVTCTVIMQCNILLYSTVQEQTTEVYSIFMVFVVLSGLYGIANIIYVSTVSTALLLVYHILIMQSVEPVTTQQRFSLVLQIVNMFFLQYIVYMWAKRNKEGSNRLQDVVKEFKQAQSSKDDFLANASHEIRTPINTICGMSELVLKEDLPATVKNKIRDIDLAGRNLMSIVRDILDFSELQSGKMELEEESYNITSTINDIINMALARKSGKRVEIIVDCDPNIPCVLLGDEKKLRRIIMNIVDNAIKFTNAGCVCIGVQFRRESYGINLLVSVKDTGIGMSEESLETIFLDFTQVDNSRTRQEEGLGLGLAISNALIQKMGGEITIKSKLDKGTTVKIAVPQKIVVDQPIVSVKNKGSLNIACYIDMEQFNMVEIRDEYANVIASMAGHLKEKYHICRNFSELQRRHEKESFSHVFTSIMEYITNQEYFDGLAEETNVVIILDDRDEKYVTNPKLLKIYKPFYILSIISVLNGQYDIRDERHAIAGGKFITEGVHALVVDDNRTNLRVAEGILQEYHIQVTTAQGGQEALELIDRAEYDFIFMDHMMPGLDGVETLKKIRSMPGTYFKKVPVIVLTANAVAGAREQLLENGFSDFLEKPIERSVLERVLKRHIAPQKFIFREDEAEQQAEQSKEQKKTEPDARLEALRQAGLDVERGALYCNGKENLLKVIRGFLEDYETSVARVEKCYRENNWKDYIIAVHGIKGAMGSIGATVVSELAKELELAGKAERWDYIRENHAPVLREYQRLFTELCKVLDSQEKQNTETEQELPEIEKEVFHQMVAELEVAAYSLEEMRMRELLSELEKFRYNGVALKEKLSAVRRKVEQSDCISAAELAVRLKDRLEGKEE